MGIMVGSSYVSLEMNCWIFLSVLRWGKPFYASCVPTEVEHPPFTKRSESQSIIAHSKRRSQQKLAVTVVFPPHYNHLCNLQYGDDPYERRHNDRLVAVEKLFPDADGPRAFPIAARGPDQGHPTPSLQHNIWIDHPSPKKGGEKLEEITNQSNQTPTEKQQMHLTITLTREQKTRVYVCTWVMHRLSGEKNEMRFSAGRTTWSILSLV